jgi:transcription factor SPN1
LYRRYVLVLASWLNLLPDHNLPNTDVRTAVIDAVRMLPIETDLNDRKEELKRSGLGRLIMFLSTLPEVEPLYKLLNSVYPQRLNAPDLVTQPLSL